MLLDSLFKIRAAELITYRIRALNDEYLSLHGFTLNQCILTEMTVQSTVTITSHCLGSFTLKCTYSFHRKFVKSHTLYYVTIFSL